MELINNVSAAPAAIGPYSQAVRVGGLLFCSGQIPINPASGKIEATDVEGQAQQVFANIRARARRSTVVDGERGEGDGVLARAWPDFPKVNPIYADGV